MTNKTHKPTTGQSAPSRHLPIELVNSKERSVLTSLRQKPSMKLAELASVAFPRQSKAKANSWTRNSLRRLVCGSWVDKVDSGTYSLTVTGRRRLSSVKGAK